MLYARHLFGVFLAMLSFVTSAAAQCPDCPAMVDVPLSSGLLRFTKTEVTFDQWQSCVAAGACRGGQDDHGWGRGTRPVINVSWDDARAYAAWLSRTLGAACRLPTEAEWQQAAAAGSSTAFWWGDSPGRGMANCRDCNPAPIYGTSPVGSFPANPWGLSDMNGNVWEWTADCWQADAAQCGQRVIKGGSWYYYSANATARARARNQANQGSYNIGIRVVCQP